MPASLMGFLRDKSEDTENMMNTFAYSTFRKAGSEKTAGRPAFFQIIHLFSENTCFLL